MDNEITFLVEESKDGGYEAKAIGFSIYTEAETLDELKVLWSTANYNVPKFIEEFKKIPELS